VPGYADKGATQQLASGLERDAAREQSGLVDRFAVHRKRPLTEHLADYEAALRNRGRAEQYVGTLIPRIRRVLTGCRFAYWPDLSASKVESYVAELQAEGLGIQSANYYLASMKQFCRWCVQDGRAPDSPLVHLTGDNARTDRRHDRRALEADELRRLLESARTGPTRFGMTGDARAMLYQLAAESGLRARELRSLVWDSFDLNADPPTVTVRAGYSKHRREDTVPLKPSTAQTLARWRDERDPADRELPVFAMPEKTAAMIRADLSDAGIEYRDADGRVCDFHALRHSFVSALARGGVHPKVAQQLARHSTITLTMDRYSHTVVGELAAGLQALPDLSRRPDAERLRATGTTDRLPFSLPLSLPKSLPTRGARGMSARSSDCTKAAIPVTVTRRENPTAVGVSCASVHRDSSLCATDLSLRREGLEPPTVGLEIRCSIRLSYGRLLD